MRAFADEAQVFVGTNPRLKFLHGFSYADQGQMLSYDKRFDQALEAHSQALTYGEYSYFRRERADTYYCKKDYPAALDDVARAIALYPQSEENYVLRSKILFEMDRFAEGISDLWTASEIWPYEDSVKKWVRGAAIHLVYKGHQLYKQKDYANALERYNLAEQCDASHAETYYWRGVLFSHQGNLASAERDLENAVQLNPRHFDSYRSLDWVLAKQGKWDAVVEHWNRFLELEPNHAKAYLERGGTFFHEGDLKRAFEDAQKACQLGEQEACARSESLRQRS
jgi:tetratricopeptide (TPR) repeat protein